ncbi:hypothetical protein ACFPIF_19460 [Brevundimonas faecalis]|uniref:hypothetical protein n=1 Tax=Brevundimonas faecalis TaxID=947378 RepID=UPI00362330FB
MVIVTEASAFDMLEALTDAGGRGRFTRQRFGEMARQVSEGAALTLRGPDGALVAVVGLWPEADHAEAWLAVGPGFRPNLLAALRAMGRALEEIVAASGTEEVRVYVRGAGRRVAGARMAAWLGFDRAGEEATPLGAVTVFRRNFGGSVHGQ